MTIPSAPRHAVRNTAGRFRAYETWVKRRHGKVLEAFGRKGSMILRLVARS